MNIELLKSSGPRASGPSGPRASGPSGPRASTHLSELDETAVAEFHSDDALVAHLSRQFREQLLASPLADLRQITVDAMGPRIVLSGCVESYYHKQLVLESVRFAFDLVEIIDDLRVASMV